MSLGYPGGTPPTVGRIVHYVPVYAPQLGDDKLKALPAIIIEVYDNQACKLGVFGTSYRSAGPVPHVQPGEDGYPVPGAWFWPPR